MHIFVYKRVEMMQPGLIENLLELDRIAKTDGNKFPRKRYVYPHLEYLLTKTRQITGIVGLRGTGKTILLRQLRVALPNSFYVSADTLPAGNDLFELATFLVEMYQIKYLFIDEIHALAGWERQLKKIYDFSDMQIIFTSSSALEITASKYDLSRRLTLQYLPLFSFREYLAFTNKGEFSPITLDDLLEKSGELYRSIYPFEADFKDFSFLRALPACLASPLSSVVSAIVEKVIQRDMLTAGKLSFEDLLQVRSVLLFLARSGIDGCSYSSISRNTGITKYKAQQYVALMQSASLVSIILPYGANVMPEPKILLVPTLRANLAQGVDENRLIGATREEFFIHHVTGASMTVNYLKSLRGEKLPDYLLFRDNRKLVFEIGGAGKGASQFKGTSVKEKFILSQPGSTQGIPLILFGFLW